MIDEKYKLMINKAIDGELSAADEKKLTAYLEHHPEARTLLEDLKLTAELLNEVPKIDPPSGLKKRILNGIDFSCYTEQAKRVRYKSLFPDWLFAPRAKLAYAFILGFFFCVIALTPNLLKLSPKQEIDTSYLSGTIKKTENINFNLIHSILIDGSGISGKINIKKFQYSNIIELDLDAVAEIEILIEYDSTQINFDNFKPIGYSKYSIDYDQDYLKIILNGSIKSSLYFTQTIPSTQIELNLSHSGNPVLSRPIILK